MSSGGKAFQILRGLNLGFPGNFKFNQYHSKLQILSLIMSLTSWSNGRLKTVGLEEYWLVSTGTSPTHLVFC